MVWAQGRRPTEKHAGHARLAFFKGNLSPSAKKIRSFDLRSDKIAQWHAFASKQTFLRENQCREFILIRWFLDLTDLSTFNVDFFSQYDRNLNYFYKK